MKVTLPILLGAFITAAAASDEFKLKAKHVNRRDAFPVPDLFMNGVQVMPAAPALRERDLRDLIFYASVPGGVTKRSLLGPRQSECVALGEIHCAFDGCCSLDTVCGTYGGQNGCCPIGKICSGVDGCKAGEKLCGSGCCPSGTICTTNPDGSDACAPGTGSSGSSSASSTGTSSSPSSTGSAGGGDRCPANYSPCAGSNTCCPAGVKCLPNKKCDSKCSASDLRCGTGCCKDGFTCNIGTSTCQESSSGSGSGSGGSDGSGNINSDNSSSSSRVISSRSTTSFTKPTTTAGSGTDNTSSITTAISRTTLGGPSAQTSVGPSGSGIIVSSPGSKLVAGMGMAGIVVVVGVALL